MLSKSKERMNKLLLWHSQWNVNWELATTKH